MAKKPTVRTMRSAAASPDNKPAPKVKTCAEIEQHLKAVLKEPHAMEYVKALRWVLGQER